MHDVLEQSTGHEPHDGDAAGHDPGAGESMEPEGQKCQRRGQVAEHHYPVIGSAVDHPIQGAEQNASGLSGHRFTHSIPIRHTSDSKSGISLRERPCQVASRRKRGQIH